MLSKDCMDGRLQVQFIHPYTRTFGFRVVLCEIEFQWLVQHLSENAMGGKYKDCRISGSCCKVMRFGSEQFIPCLDAVFDFTV